MGRVLSTAQANAPFATGAYRSSLHIEQDTTDRAGVRVVSDTDHSMFVEAKTGNLARALDAAGGSGEVDTSRMKVRYTTKAGKTILATQAQVDNWTRGR